jgi:hypothetical protein
MHIQKLEKPVPQLIGGIDNKIILEEIGLAMEEAYPSADGRPFVHVLRIYDNIRENPAKYPTINMAVSDRYLKTILTIAFRRIYKWKQHTSRNIKRKSNNVFIRPEVK